MESGKTDIRNTDVFAGDSHGSVCESDTGQVEHKNAVILKGKSLTTDLPLFCLFFDTVSNE